MSSSETGNAVDIKAAESTYGGFISLIKWAIPVIVVIVAVVILLIS
jgi:hypothetical protein